MIAVAVAALACGHRATTEWQLSVRTWGGPPGSDHFRVTVEGGGELLVERLSGRSGAVLVTSRATLASSTARELRGAAERAIRGASLVRHWPPVADGTSIELVLEGVESTISCSHRHLMNFEQGGPDLARVVQVINAAVPERARVF